MHMIDVMKRLAELDAGNPNVLKENSTVAECGPMGMIGSMASSNIPANINITAASGEELSNMLGAIMRLAGVEKVTPDHFGVEHEPVAFTAGPAIAVGSSVGDSDDMRAVLDKMNDAGEDDQEETDEGYDEFGISGVNNTPHRPDAHGAFDANQFAHHENQPGSGDNEHGHKRTGMQPIATYESLMAEYKKFVAEDADDNVNERMGEAIPIRIKFEDGTTIGEHIVDGEETSMMSRPELVKHFSEKYKMPVAEITMSTESRSHQAPAPDAEPSTGFGYRDDDATNRAISRYDRQLPENSHEEGNEFDGAGNNLRDNVLSVLEEIYQGALAGEDMIDYVTDELGDYFTAVKKSGDKTLKQAYSLMRNKGMEAEGDSQLMARVAKKAISMLDDRQLPEMFQFEKPPGKDRGPRDRGPGDELARRQKALGKGSLGKGGHAGKEYKEKDRYGDAYKIAGPKGRLPENR